VIGVPLLMVKKYCPRVVEEFPLADIVDIHSVRELPGRIRDRYGTLPEKVGVEMDVLSANDFRFYETLLPASELTEGGSPIISSSGSAWMPSRIFFTLSMMSSAFFVNPSSPKAIRDAQAVAYAPRRDSKRDSTFSLFYNQGLRRQTS
jgi:hypothetical protein